LFGFSSTGLKAGKVIEFSRYGNLLVVVILFLLPLTFKAQEMFLFDNDDDDVRPATYSVGQRSKPPAFVHT